MNVHYDTTTGQIVSYGYGADHSDGFDASPYPGCAVALLDDQPVDPRTQQFDVVAWKLVARTDPYDPESDRVAQLRDAVRAELAASDKFMMPDYPMSDAARAAWTVYRQALRDCSKGNATSAAMLAAIPARPDGSTLTLSPEVTT
ncbi:phage tail assembly chaperone [Bradyrhizobium sp. WU425]|uniref:phage tail assembly chaperone n=1 Tax=Bradyrhizobium sp. WU425 TaxID=187029 RepID=UPI001E5F3E7F|nr:phage tail assembly chaperone [Bradyrhizobium canariense]UFW75214.1 phage tail assembly chaperone [Bradyrhizobium canariense]